MAQRSSSMSPSIWFRLFSFIVSFSPFVNCSSRVYHHPHLCREASAQKLQLCRKQATVRQRRGAQGRRRRRRHRRSNSNPGSVEWRRQSLSWFVRIIYLNEFFLDNLDNPSLATTLTKEMWLRHFSFQCFFLWHYLYISGSLKALLWKSNWRKWGAVSCSWRSWSQMIACYVFHPSWMLFHLQIWGIFPLGYVLPSNVVFTSDGAKLDLVILGVKFKD